VAKGIVVGVLEGCTEFDDHRVPRDVVLEQRGFDAGLRRRMLHGNQQAVPALSVNTTPGIKSTLLIRRFNSLS
jgi:hypothetical protein